MIFVLSPSSDEELRKCHHHNNHDNSNQTTSKSGCECFYESTTVTQFYAFTAALMMHRKVEMKIGGFSMPFIFPNKPRILHHSLRHIIVRHIVDIIAST